MSKSYDPRKLGPRIRIKDLKTDTKISKKEMSVVLGGAYITYIRKSKYSFRPFAIDGSVMAGKGWIYQPPD